MEFKISTSGCYVAEEIINEYPTLNDFGFKLVEEHYTWKQRIKNPDGGYLIQETPKVRKHAFINIDTLEEFMKLSTAVGYGLILFMPNNHENVDIPEIEIYDGWRE